MCNKIRSRVKAWNSPTSWDWQRGLWRQAMVWVRFATKLRKGVDLARDPREMAGPNIFVANHNFFHFWNSPKVTVSALGTGISMRTEHCQTMWKHCETRVQIGSKDNIMLFPIATWSMPLPITGIHSISIVRRRIETILFFIVCDWPLTLPDISSYQQSLPGTSATTI